MRAVIFSCIFLLHYFPCCFSDVPKLDESHLGEAISSHKLLLAYIRPTEECNEQCQNSAKVLTSVGHATSFFGIKIVDVYSPSLLKVFQLPDEPKLLFYRDGIPLVFESEAFEVEEITDWVSVNYEVALKRLDNANFEHLTQATSGSTTGDWFIFFYNKKCSQFIPIWETLAVRLKQHKVVAIVDTDSSPQLKRRFSIKKCPTAIFLRSGRMYSYTLPMNDLTSLGNFAEGWYRNVLSQTIPPVQTPFDDLTTYIATQLKESQTTVIVLVIICAAVALLLTLLCLKHFLGSSKAKLF